MKLILQYLSSVVLTVALFSSCISTEEVNYLQNIKTGYLPQEYQEYRLNVQDLISCTISSSDEELVRTFNYVLTDNQAVAKAYTIYEDSTIILPYFGKIKVVGYTVQEAEAAIQRFMQQSVKDVQVKVNLSSNYFYILADNKRGQFSVYKDNMNIYEALAISGQTTGMMDLTRVKIIRKDANGKPVEKEFDLRSQEIIQSEFYYVKPNDLIYFPTNKNAFFNIESLGSFTSAMMIPLTFLLYTVMYNF